MLQSGHTVDGRRITKRSPPPITMTCVAFDFDPPRHEPDAAWSADAQAKLAALVAMYAGYAYSTRAGWRWVVALAQPALIHTAQDWADWRASYGALCDWLEREHGLAADRSCSEPGRLFRLPDVVRDGVRQVPTVLGSVDELGAFELPEAPAAERSPLAVSPEPPQSSPLGVNDEKLQPERSLLYRLLQAPGAILGEHEPGAYRIRCPRNRLHSVGRPGDSSTLLYLPSGPSGYGEICCKHASCANMSTPDWIAALDDGTQHSVRRLVRIEGVGIDQARDGVALSVRVRAADAGGELPLRYLKVYSRTAARWRALFESAGVELPEDLLMGGDLSAACSELRGRLLTLELEGSTVRMILPGQEQAA